MRRAPLIVVAILGTLLLTPSASAVHPKTVDFIAGFEGFEPEPYPDPAGHCTIGYGHLIHRGGCTHADFRKWGTLSKKRARKLLIKNLRSYESAVLERIGDTPVNREMMTALTSFAFNLGPGMLDRYRSPYLKRTTNVAGKMRKRDYLGAARDMRIYDAIIEDDKRKPLKGLTRRRNKEFRLMRQGIRRMEKCGTKCTDAQGAEAPDTPDPGNVGGLPIR